MSALEKAKCLNPHRREGRVGRLLWGGLVIALQLAVLAALLLDYLT